MTRAAIFIDRDGTINVEKNYLHRVEDWEWIPGSVDAIRAFNNAGFLVIVISNQAGVARGLYSETDIHRLHAHVSSELVRRGARIDAYYYCPHHPGFGKDRDCTCRKPLPGLILKAQKDFDIDLSNSWMVGDTANDVKAGSAAGVRCILVATGYGSEERAKLGAVPYAENLQVASQLIFSASK